MDVILKPAMGKSVDNFLRIVSPAGNPQSCPCAGS